MKLSSVIITKNSEDVIEACLKSVSFSDEIILVDAGSSDQTRVIAKKTGAIIVNGSKDDFSEQRTIGLKAAKGEWILYVDADEKLSEELVSSIIRQLARQVSSIENEYSAFRLNRKNFYYGDHEWPYIEQIIRLFHRKDLEGWQGSLHESPVIKGKVGELNGYLLHYTHKNLFSMVEKTNQWSQVEAKLRFEKKHPRMETWRFLRVMATAFFNSYVSQNGWRVGTSGIVESVYQAFSIFITYAKLWEMQK